MMGDGNGGEVTASVTLLDRDPKSGYTLYKVSKAGASVVLQIDSLGLNDKFCPCSVFQSESESQLLNHNKQSQDVDVLLLTNAFQFFNLPHLLKSMGEIGRNKVKIYATEGTLAFGKRLLLEFYSNLMDMSLTKIAAGSTKEGVGFASFTSICTKKDDIDYYLQHVTSCVFGEEIKLDDNVELICWPLPSGYCIGSTVWTIGHHSNCVLFEPLYMHVGLSSACASRHPKELDIKSLRSCKAIGFSQVISGNFNLQSRIDAVQQVCERVVQSCSNGGNVLIPCFPFVGLSLDVIECVAHHLKCVKLDNVKLIIAANEGNEALSFLEYVSEYLSREKQNRIFEGEDAFDFRTLVDEGRLIIAKRLGDFMSSQSKYYHGQPVSVAENPMVVFTGCPCLCTGESRLVVDTWKSERKNSFVFIYSNYDPNELLKPFRKNSETIMANVHWCPIDTRLCKVEAMAVSNATTSTQKTIFGLDDNDKNLQILSQCNFSSINSNKKYAANQWPTSITDKFCNSKLLVETEKMKFSFDTVRIVGYPEGNNEDKKEIHPHILVFFRKTTKFLLSHNETNKQRKTKKTETPKSNALIDNEYIQVKIVLGLDNIDENYIVECEDIKLKAVVEQLIG